MLDTLRGLIAKDPDYSARSWTLEIRRRVLKGTIYDPLAYSFHQESTSGRYIPLSERRPSARYGLCKIVVRDAIALLFGEGRFPAIDTADKGQRELLVDVVRDIGLAQAMTDAAWRGAIGSVAIRLRLLRDRLFVDALDAVHLTPEYDPEAPDTLLRVIEERKVKGSDLLAVGYGGLDPEIVYWFRREWTRNEELWMQPLTVTARANGDDYQRDDARTVVHQLGFVPMVWVRNLPGGDEPDGDTTFPDEVIRTGMEIDYLLSQGGRGLRYSLDPTLLIKEPAASDATLTKGVDALIVSKDGDAKLLEIGGTASAAVLEWCKGLRELALETAHGNRSNADKLAAAQSGRAMELMHLPLIQLADDLRTSYGNAILDLTSMIARTSQAFRIKLRDGTEVKLDPAERCTLRWPPWFAPTHEDKQAEATTLVTLTGGALMSRETGIKKTADTFDTGDVEAEMARIKADVAEADARLARQAAQTKASEHVES